MRKRSKILATVILSLLFSGAQIAFSQNGTGTDVLEPSDIENFEAVALDTEIQLKWDSAKDNVGVTGYKIYRGTKSVQSENDEYNEPVISVGNVTEYTVKNLTNGQTYYFTVTAVDAAGNESPNYAAEVSATPKTALKAAAEETDSKAPQAKEVKAEDIVTVLTIFSEPVELPVEAPESAFQIEKNSDKSRLTVQKAELDSRDETKATVLLTTEPQEEGTEYVLTAGIEIQDLAGNPIVSGTSDTGSFKGSAKKKPEPKAAEAEAKPAAEEPKDTDPPVVAGGSADFNDRMSVHFSESVQLPTSPKSQFSIVKKGTSEKLGIINVSLSVDSKTAYITTDPQQAVEYVVSVAGVKDAAGNEVKVESASLSIPGKGPSIQDLVPPEDVTKLIARLKSARDGIVELRWQPSKNSDGDLADQLLYQSPGKKPESFGAGTSLGTSTASLEVQDLASGWHTFKMTAKDTSNNESTGALASIFLPETGPGILAAAIASLVSGWYWKKRRSK